MTPPKTKSADTGRVLDEPAFLLHTYPYKETSLLCELFTRHHGRIMAVAKGAKRASSSLRGQLHPFQLLSISVVGKGEVKTLSKTEWQPTLAYPKREQLMMLFYVNELLIKTLEREDPHEALFDAYQALLMDELQSEGLRYFELFLLQELGYGLKLTHTADNITIVDDGSYRYIAEQGLVPCRLEHSQAINGLSLRTLHEKGALTQTAQLDAKRLTRSALAKLLDHRELHSRQLLQDVAHLK